MQKGISLIFVNYNTSDHIMRCLNSLNEITEFDDYEVLIVDNKSQPEDFKKIESYPGKHKIILNESNSGFGAACNAGAKNAAGKYLLFANPDTIFTNNVFTELLRLMEADPNIGIATCSLINQRNESVYSFNDFPGLKYEFSEAIGRGTHNSILRKIDFLEQNKERIFECDWVVGAFMFIRKTEFDKVNGFDEDFFLYYEDTDLCKRIKSNGNKIVVVPYLSVIHTQMSSVRSTNGENVFYYHLNRSNLIYSHKHFSFAETIIIRVAHIVGYSIRLINLPFRKRFKSKRNLKFYQYIIIIKLYFLTYNSVLRNKYKVFKKFSEDADKEYEEFWKK